VPILRAAGALFALGGIALVLAIGFFFYAPTLPNLWLLDIADAAVAAAAATWAIAARGPLSIGFGLIALGWLAVLVWALAGETAFSLAGSAAAAIGAVIIATLTGDGSWRDYRILLGIAMIVYLVAGVAPIGGVPVPTDLTIGLRVGFGLILLIGGLVIWRRRPRASSGTAG
jgi:hypothetical protein